MAYVPGLFGFVKVNGVAQAFDEFDAPEEMILPDVSNFTSQGARQIVTGPVSGNFTAKGPYNEGTVNLTLGQSVTLVLGIDSGTNVGVSSTCLVKSLKIMQKYTDAARLEVTFWTNGVWTNTIA